ncbi:MAG: N-acetyltransferase [Chloroflexota bacterium]|nr:MAG: N-acetyltransferase [Chloroflexota bacterium]
MSLEIERVETKAQLKEFIKVPWTVYEDDPYWVPFLYFERQEFFDKSKSPFFEHAEADYFTARRDGLAIGAITAVMNHRYNEFQDENTAHFGTFEVIEDAEAAAALLQTACDWARDRGADKIQGPANLSSNEEFGLLIEGYDSPPVIMMPYNPAYYAEFIEAAGFEKAMDLYAWNNNAFELNEPGGLPPKLIRVVEKVKKRYGLSIRNVNMKDWDNEVERIKEIYNSAWQKNWGFVPMTDTEIDHLAANLKMIIDPSIVFAVEAGGKTVGFSLSLPDVNQPLHRIRPGPSTIGSYIAAGRMLLNKRNTDRLRVFALGVLEEYRGKGVDALMYYETVKAAAANNYEWGEMSWILENNDDMNRPIETFGSEIYKRYRVYEKQLSDEADD